MEKPAAIFAVLLCYRWGKSALIVSIALSASTKLRQVLNFFF